MRLYFIFSIVFLKNCNWDYFKICIKQTFAYLTCGESNGSILGETRSDSELLTPWSVIPSHPIPVLSRTLASLSFQILPSSSRFLGSLKRESPQWYSLVISLISFLVFFLIFRELHNLWVFNSLWSIEDRLISFSLR